MVERDTSGRGSPAKPAVSPERVDAGVARLFATHRLPMVRLAVLLVDDLGTAEDVTQDAFAALYRRWASLPDESVAAAYLRTCVVNGCRSVLRRRQTVRRIHLTADVGPSEGADEPVLVAEEHRQVLHAISQLPPRQREVMVLRYWADLSEAEIARALGVSVGTVKKLAFRARGTVAAALGGFR